VSSAILYVAIVAIWIGVLVPRWLRHEHTRGGQLRLRRLSARPGAQAPAGSDNKGENPIGYNSEPQSNGGAYVPAPVSGNAESMAPLSEAEVPTPVRPYGWSAEEYLRQQRASERGRPPERPAAEPAGSAERGAHRDADLARRDGKRPPRPDDGGRPGDGEQAGPPSGERPGTADSERRARVVRGRRRMLWILLVIMAIAAGLAYLSLAAWWIVVPPVVLLLGYLLLLREAAYADAEARERAATMARRAREADARRAREAEAERAADAQREQDRRAAQAGTPPGGSAPVWAAHETLSHAEIIDISERVGDQLYDQYADAKLRAVGD